MTGLSCVLFVLTGRGASEKSLLLYLDHFEGIAVPELSRVLAFCHSGEASQTQRKPTLY